MGTDKASGGALIVIGGHEDKQGDRDILERFIAMAGGRDANIVIMTLASTNPVTVGTEYEVLFTKIGVGAVRSIHADDCRTRPEEVIEHLRRATGVFFVGGQPYRITEVIRGTAIHQELAERRRQGMILAGTSAGALMMSEITIMDGKSRVDPSEDTIELGEGLGFLKGLVIDVHFAERGRCGRMLSAIAKAPECLGIGIDEDAAMIIRDETIEVVGRGSLFIFDPGADEFRDVTPPGNENISLINVRLHVLSPGCLYDLSKRRYIGCTSTDSQAAGV